MTGGERRFDVLALGEPTVEFNQRDAGESTYLRGFGGDTSNAAIAAARQGARAAYASAVGDDAFRPCGWRCGTPKVSTATRCR